MTSTYNAFRMICTVVLTATAFNTQAVITSDNISHYPSALPTNCRDNTAEIYDECGDQVRILNAAVAEAKRQNKSVLVMYGGEWCTWCHVLTNHFDGKFRAPNYQWRTGDENIEQWTIRAQISQQDVQAAQNLTDYIADNFVIANIDSAYTNGAEAIDSTGIDSSQIGYFPYIIAVDDDGEYINYINVSDTMQPVEARDGSGTFQAYNRTLLEDQLRYLRSQDQ